MHMPTIQHQAMNLVKPTLNLEILDDLMKVMWCYESNCVLGCCGIKSLDFGVQRGIDGVRSLGLEVAEQALEQLEDMQWLVGAHEGPVSLEGAGGFAQGWPANAAPLLFLQQMHASLSAAINHVKHNARAG